MISFDETDFLGDPYEKLDRVERSRWNEIDFREIKSGDAAPNSLPSLQLLK